MQYGLIQIDLIEQDSLPDWMKMNAKKWIDGEIESVWTEGEYSSFNEAKKIVDNMNTSTVSYYIHNNSNRVLYEKKEKT